ncbi:MAG: hypothetical protein NQU46_05835 [Methanolinea sp.]|nr:hypothetical protein [Methanolinea sp.]
MERRDIAILMVALAAMVILAGIVKPVLTGKAPDLSLPFLPGPGEETPTSLPTAVIPRAPATTLPSPSPTPTWSGKTETLGYVGLESPPATPTFTRFPPDTPVQERLLTYAAIQAQAGGITQAIAMPFPYWELHYTVDPWKTTFVGTTSSRMGGQAEFFAAEVFPSFSIEVRDAADGSLVRRIEPEGGLNAQLWEKDKESDPRPWVEKFYEGLTPRSYYFVVKTHMIYSYRMEVKVPERYLGKY